MWKSLKEHPSLDTLDPFSSGPEMNLDKWTKELEN